MENTAVIRYSPKLDWLTLSYWILANHRNAYYPYIAELKKILPHESFNVKATGFKITLESDDLYIVFHHHFFYFQFRGSFFTKSNLSKQIIRELAILISYAFSNIENSPKIRYCTISRIDIAQDFINTTPANLIACAWDEKNLRQFSAEPIIRHNKYNIETSRNLEGSRFKIRCYRKDLELIKHASRNLDKVLYYQKLYPKGSAVARFEIEINESKNLGFAGPLLYDETISEEEMCKIVLLRFFKKHRLKIIQKDSNKSRWLDCPEWKNLFIPDTNVVIPKYDFKVNELCFNPLIAKMQTSKLINLAADNIKQLRKENLNQDYLTKAIEKAVSESDERDNLKILKNKKTLEYYKKLAEAASKVDGRSLNEREPAGTIEKDDPDKAA